MVIIDGNSFIYRAFHGSPPHETSSGIEVGGVHGFYSMVKGIHERWPWEQKICIFDHKDNNFRHTIYPQYKANRPPTPEPLKKQIPIMSEVPALFDMATICVPGVEADDVIGTIVTSTDNSIIVSGDKDLCQLLGPTDTLVDTMKNVSISRMNVVEKFGVLPDQIPDYLALVGDAADNIPGCPSVGPKKAGELLKGFSGIDDLYKNLDYVSNMSFRGAKSTAEKLAENKDKVYLSYDLAKIKLDVDIPEFKFTTLSLEEKANLKNRLEISQ